MSVVKFGKEAEEWVVQYGNNPKHTTMSTTKWFNDHTFAGATGVQNPPTYILSNTSTMKCTDTSDAIKTSPVARMTLGRRCTRDGTRSRSESYIASEINAQYHASVVEGKRRIYHTLAKWHSIDTKWTTNKRHDSLCYTMFLMSSNGVHVSWNIVNSEVPKIKQHPNDPTFLPFDVGIWVQSPWKPTWS